MAETRFPTALDSDADLYSPATADLLIAGHHNVPVDAIQALQVKVGIDGSSNTFSIDYKLLHLPAQLALLDMNSYRIANLGAPSVGTDAANKTYVDNTFVENIGPQGPQGETGATGAGVDQLTTKGDLLGYGSSADRLAVGSNDQVLTADSTQTLGVKWAAIGNATTATALETARTINGVSFNGTANITVTAAAGTLSGTELKSTVVTSSLTSVGTLTDLTVTNAIVGSVTGNAATVTNATLTTALTVNTGTLTLTADAANNSVLTIGAGAVSVSGSNTGDQSLSGYALVNQTMYIGTTAVAINRGTAALTLAGITLTTPDIGTPSAGTLTNCSFPTLNQNTTGSSGSCTGEAATVATITGLAPDTATTQATQAAITSLGTLTSLTMGGTLQLGETSVKLDATLSADEKWSGITTSGVSGVTTLAIGDLIYLNADDSRWELADANLSDGYDKQLGIALTAAADGAALEVLVFGKIRSAAFPAFTVGSPLYMSETGGDMTHTQPTTTDACVRLLGFALTQEDLLFQPSNDYFTHT